MKFLLANLPFLGWSFIQPITAYFVELVLKAILEHGETAAFFLYIDMRVGAQAKGFESAALANYLAQQGGTNEEKKLAETRLKNEFIAFIMLSS